MSETTNKFTRDMRLIKPAQFSRVFANAKNSRDRFYTVLFMPTDKGTARLGFAIAKKKISAATGRNRVRRIARESFRQKRSELPAVDIIILAQSAAAGATNAELFASLDRHWSRITATGSA